MRICFPVFENAGMESRIYDHFGSAPKFLIFDTETHELDEVINNDQRHTHGACRPLKALGETSLGAIVVRGIGGGAFHGLSMAGLKVYLAKGVTVAENITSLQNGELGEVREVTCANLDMKHGKGCGHQTL